ncbi:hypothetical protein KSP40_PGU015958 [Platanthera guangdongensis]|uniref:Uncharacterized protein n=1 Tax=Platanthera guangdongensis TaxID=2320717 RepID=A0ABR2N5C9_9ASPA
MIVEIGSPLVLAALPAIDQIPRPFSPFFSVCHPEESLGYRYRFRRSRSSMPAAASNICAEGTLDPSPRQQFEPLRVFRLDFVNMFWRMPRLSAASPVDIILEKENCTLQELLDEDEIIQECKSLNERLINFFVVDNCSLRERAQVEQLLRYIVEEAPDEAEKKQSFKFPFIACEIFTCEVDNIFTTLIEDEELMDLLFSFLKPNRPHSTMLAGYFGKGHPEIFHQLVDLIGITSIMEVLIRLIGADENMYSNYSDALQWVDASDLLDLVVDKFSSSAHECGGDAAEEFLGGIGGLGRGWNQEQGFYQRCRRGVLDGIDRLGGFWNQDWVSRKNAAVGFWVKSADWFSEFCGRLGMVVLEVTSRVYIWGRGATRDSPEVHANAAEFLCAVTRYAPSGLAAKICSPSFVGRLFRHALDGSRPKSVLVHSLSVCISLLDPKRLLQSSYQSSRSQLSRGTIVMANPETVAGMLESLGTTKRKKPSLCSPMSQMMVMLSAVCNVRGEMIEEEMTT